MQKFSWIIIFLSLLLNLSACHAQDQEHGDLYSYLMQHPMKLKKEMTECQKAADASSPLTPHCVTVMKAADQMMAMVDDQRRNPERFGQDILQAQMEMGAQDTEANQDKVKVMLAVVGLSSPE